MQEWTIREESELTDIASTVLGSLKERQGAQFLALRGDLGAGKTAFTKALARALGVHEDVTSPTFVIMKGYPLTGHPFLTELIHIDAYRIESDDELRVLGFEELLKEPHRLIVLEWPERVMGLIPQHAHTLSLTIHGDGTRTITYDE